LSTQIAPANPVERNRRFRSWAIIILTNLLSLICLAWVLNGANFHRIWGEIRHMNGHWVLLAVFSDACVYVLHGLRWKLLLNPVERVSFWNCVQAIYVGLFANEVLPLRAGELIRCFLLSKSSSIPISVTFASALIERIFDGVWLMCCFFFSMHMGRLPGVLVKGGYILGVMIVLLGILLAYAMYARKQSLDLFLGMSWPRWLNTLIEDLHLIGHSRYLYFAFLISGLYMFSQMLPIYATIRASNLPVPWTAAFTMMVLLRLSSIVPQAPGNLGSFQWVTARTLIMFGLASALSRRFSLILWAVLTIPLIVIGFIALALEGVSLTHLHREAAASARNSRES
jgi:glycosyltransferase 2 family protein